MTIHQSQMIPKMDIDKYRGPMVTAVGIFLGFMLNFTNSWVPKAFTKDASDIIIGVAVVSTICLLVTVVYRILRPEYGEEGAKKFYKKTLRMFIIGICIPFTAMMIILIKRLAIASLT
ncbi:MAG TPA: hypothetical protein VFI06_16160 [Chitinophagaceae bacterium]|nr:hypothetical protein [Chitinophagaceae bacterium]